MLAHYLKIWIYVPENQLTGILEEELEGGQWGARADLLGTSLPKPLLSDITVGSEISLVGVFTPLTQKHYKSRLFPPESVAKHSPA